MVKSDIQQSKTKQQINYFIVFFFAIEPFMRCIFLEPPDKLIGILRLGLIIPAFIFEYTLNPQRSPNCQRKYITFFLLVLSFLVVCGLLFGNHKEFVKQTFTSTEFLFSILLFLFFSVNRSAERELVEFRSICALMLFFSSIACIIGRYVSEYMTYGYTIVLFWGLFLFIKKNDLLSNILLLVSGVLLGLFANRGALILIVLLIMVKSIWFSNRQLKMWILLLLAITAVGSILFRDSIYVMLLQMDSGLSRNIVKMISGDFFIDNARKDIWDTIIAQINRYPLSGQGLCADRYILQYNQFGNYPHNFALELLVQYGYIFGGVFILYLILVVIRSIFMKHENNILLLPIAVSVIVIFSFSKSIWTSYEVYILFALFNKYKRPLLAIKNTKEIQYE